MVIAQVSLSCTSKVQQSLPGARHTQVQRASAVEARQSRVCFGENPLEGAEAELVAHVGR
jgi:hypothetical protein